MAVVLNARHVALWTTALFWGFCSIEAVQLDFGHDDLSFNSSAATCFQKVAFFHIPKTGGREIMSALSSFVEARLSGPSRGLSKVKGNWSGHFTAMNASELMVSSEGLHPFVVEFHTTELRASEAVPLLKSIRDPDGCGVITATLLREPIERMVSMLHYDMETGCLPSDAVLHMNPLFGNVSNVQSRFLRKGLYCWVCGEFWKSPKTHLCSVNVSNADHQANVQLLSEGFDVVGVDNDIEGFAKTILVKMGFPRVDVDKNFKMSPIPSSIPQVMNLLRYGIVPLTEQRVDELPSDILRTLQFENKYDFELYGAATALASFNRRVKENFVDGMRVM